MMVFKLLQAIKAQQTLVLVRLRSRTNKTVEIRSFALAIKIAYIFWSDIHV